MHFTRPAVRTAALAVKQCSRRQWLRDSADDLENPVETGFFERVADDSDEQVLLVDGIETQLGQQAEGFDLPRGFHVGADAGAFHHFVANPDNPGFAVACNQGAADSDAPWLAFVNPDLMVEPDTLARLRLAAEILSPALVGAELVGEDDSGKDSR